MYNQQIKIGTYTTSRTELREIFIAWAAISVAFAIVMGGGLLVKNFVSTFLMSALTVGIGFLFHEMGHKIVAQRYGCFAEFRAFRSMLWFMLAMSFFGIVFAAPGAVFIQGPVGTRRNGKIAAAGPIVNLLLALFFITVLVFLEPSGIIKQISSFGVRINSWLALFNMIPIWQLDGKKVLLWNKVVYGFIVAIALMFTFWDSYLRVFLGG